MCFTHATLLLALAVFRIVGDFWQMMGAFVVGNAITGFLLVINGSVGAKLRLEFKDVARATFGKAGGGYH